MLGELKNTTMKKSLMILAMVILLSQFVTAQNPQWVYYGHNMPPGSGFVRSIAVDSSRSVIWFGLWAGGILKFDGASWTHYDTLKLGLFSTSITALDIADNGIIYIGSGKGVGIFDGINCQVFDTSNSDILHNAIFSVKKSSTGQLLAATWGGLSVLDLNTHKFTNYTTTNSGLPWNIVTSVNAEAHVKWIGTTARGLARFDDTTWTIYNTTNSGIVYDHVNKIIITPDNIKWINCRLGGISRFDESNNYWSTYFSSSGGQTGAIDFNTGNMARGAAGLLFFRNSDSTYQFFDHTNSPLTEGGFINSLEFDKYGNLWIGGNEYVYNPNGVVGIDNNSTIITEIPKVFKLYQNFPNPFNPSTKIRYQIFKGTEIKLSIYDMNGKFITTIESGYKPKGEYEVYFDGSGLSTGVYFYKLETESYNEAKRMLLIK